VPAVSIPQENAGDYFGFLGGFLAADVLASSTLTGELLGWQLTHPGLIEDLEQGHYFEAPRATA
jgi:hypothetical protein